MVQADSNRLNLALVEELIFGEVPSGPPTLTNLRYTTDGLTFESNFTNSAEIRSDRQIPDVVRVGANSAGELGYELSYGAHDQLLEAGFLSSDWTTQDPVAITDSQTIASNVITRDAGDYVADGFVVGQWVTMSGWDVAANNILVRVSAVDTLTLTVVAATLTDEAVGETDVTITIEAYIQNGTEFRSFTIEKEFTDLTTTFSVFRGMAVDTINLTIGADEILNGTFGFIGKDEQSPRPTATVGDGTNDAAASNDVMNGVDHVTSVLEGSAYDTELPITAFTLALANSLRARLQVGTLGAVSLGTGTVGVTGTIQSFFETQDQMNKYLAATATALAFIFTDSAANRYVLDMPRMRFTSGATVAAGQNQDILADLGYTAYRDVATDQTIRLTRIPV